MTIADVVRDISANHYVLPSIQCEFVWSMSQIELFDSVLQDYPFGAFLFWELLLAAIPNIEKQDKAFAEWFPTNYLTDQDKIQYRKINYLPEMDYTYDNFLKFAEARRNLLKDQMKKEFM